MTCPVHQEVPTTEVWVNFYQVPGGTKITCSVHPTKENAELFDPPEGGWTVSKKVIISRQRMSVLCVAGRFDF